MGNTISAKQLNDALEKARSVGIVEEPFNVGDVEVVLRNLRPDEYEAIIDETKELEDVQYLDAYMKGHIARSLVQLNGFSFRGVQFVECEEPDPKKPGQLRAVKRELHDWIKQEVLSTWGKEVIFVAYRKFTDVVTLAEQKSKENVTFIVPEEDAPEKYRRLVGELRELEGEVPPNLVEGILKENGYQHYTVSKDIAAMKELDDQAGKSAVNEGPAPAVPQAPPAPPVAAPVAPPPPQQAPSNIAQVMRQRVPLNQQAVDVPPPPAPSVAPPPDMHPQAPQPPAVMQLPQAPPMSQAAQRWAATLAEDAQFDPTVRAQPPMGVQPPPPGTVSPLQPTPDVPVLSHEHAEHTNPQELSRIVEQPPRVGINPKFRPPQR